MTVKRPDGTLAKRTEDVYRTDEGYVLSDLDVLMPWTPASFFALRDANAEHLKTLDVFHEMGKARNVRELLAAHEIAGTQHIALGPQLRPPTADVLEALADLLADGDSPLSEPDHLHRIDRVLATLVDCIRERREQTGDDLFSAGSIVIAVRRAVASLVPDDLADELPSRH